MKNNSKNFFFFKLNKNKFMGCCSGKNISVKENEESLLKSIEINTQINEEEYLNIIQSNINRV